MGGNVLILHLSDFHINNLGDTTYKKIKRIADCLIQYKNCNTVFIICSGDLTNSGHKKQFILFDTLINNLKNKISEICSLNKNNIHIIMCPGNHDVKFPIFYKRLRKSIPIDAKTFDKKIKSALQKFKNYYNYSSCVQNSVNPLLEISNFVDDEGNKFHFYSLNNSVFAYYNPKKENKDKDKGRIYIPNNFFPHPTRSVNTYNFLIMHYPPSYFSEETTVLFNSMIDKFSGVFCGHLHEPLTSIQFSISGKPNFISQSNCFENPSNNISGFSIIVIRNDSFYRVQYIWDDKKGFYNTYGEGVPAMVETTTYQYDSFSLLKKYSESKFEDSLVISKSGSVLDYFVFPSLCYKKDSINNTINGKIEDFDKLDKIVDKYNYIELSGSYTSGKTTLLRFLWIKYSSKGLSILLDGDVFNHRKPNKYDDILMENIINQYGDACLEKIKQVPIKNLYVFIDNFSQIDDQLSVIYFLKKKFGHIFYIQDKYKNIFKVNDILQNRQIFIPVESEGIVLDLEMFYKKKRKKLIENVYKCIMAQRLETFEYEKFEIFYQKIETIIHSKIAVINLTPFSIIMLVRQLLICPTTSGSILYNDLYTSNINITINKSSYAVGVKGEQFYIAFMQMIAYKLNESRSNTFSISFIENEAKDFNVKRRSNISPIKFINLFLDAHIISQNTDGRYYFVNRHYFAYFVSREFLKLYSEGTISEIKIKYLLDNAFDGINTSILLFVACSQQNIKIVEFIVNKAVEKFAKLTEFNFNSFALLSDTQKSIQKFSALSEKEKEKRINEAEKKEKEAITNEEKQNHYIFVDKQLTDFEKDVNLMLDYIELLASIFSSFAHIMDASKQDKNVLAVLSLSNKLIYKFNYNIDLNRDKIIAVLQKLLLENGHNVDEKKLLNFLRINILDSILGIYDYAARNISDEGVYKVISNSIGALPPNETYILQKLMIQSFVLAPHEFANEAIKINNVSTNKYFSICVKVIVQRYYWDHPEMISDTRNKKFVETFVDTKEKKFLFFKEKKE